MAREDFNYQTELFCDHILTGHYLSPRHPGGCRYRFRDGRPSWALHRKPSPASPLFYQIIRRKAEREARVCFNVDELLEAVGNRNGEQSYYAMGRFFEAKTRFAISLMIREARHRRCWAVDPAITVSDDESFDKRMSIKFWLCPDTEPVICFPFVNPVYTPHFMATWDINVSPRTHQEFPIQPPKGMTLEWWAAKREINLRDFNSFVYA